MEAIEARRADVIVVAYFDRLVRSIKVQAEIVDRVERAGGNVLTLDAGTITNGKAAVKLQANMLGSIAQYVADQTRDKVGEAQERAVARGATPWARVPIGYTRSEGTLTPDPETVPLVRKVFAMRDKGSTISEIRAMLNAEGIERSPRGVQVMLSNRVYLGEIHFGKLVNTEACEPIIDRDLWERVQRRRVPRGPKPRSELLLARLGVLRCGSCGGRMSAAIMPQGGGYPIYRCGSTSDCDSHFLIAAHTAEQVVVEAVRNALADVQGRASAESNVREAEQELEAAQGALDAALRAFAGFEDERAAVDRLAELREARDEARAVVDQRLGGSRATVTLNGNADWDVLTADEQRGLIRATVESAIVGPGRGAGRITVKIFGQ